MIIFWRLLLAHLLTDFTFQTDKIANWKRKSIFGVVVHAGIFLALSVLLCMFSENFVGISFSYLSSTWWKFTGIVSIILLSLIHFGEDYYRVWSIKKVSTTDNIFFYLWDQFIHIVFVFLFAPTDTGKFIQEKFIVVIILAILVTHFSSIIIYYLEEITYGTQVAFNTFKKKYIFIFERLILSLCFLLPGLSWLIVIPAIGIKLTSNKLLKHFYKGTSSTTLNTTISILLSVIIGILTRFLVYQDG
ncbi:MAG: DUF3307 domain-containing protein [Elusimicrobiota bacterium]|nr:DUF3307 domain-containing protein [Elusimicrobiota bacterium]